jgi:hypothetical protein
MYAQLIEGGTAPDRRARMDRLVSDELVPALEIEPGSRARSTSSTATAATRS